ncbi:MAG: hypothetical protein ACI9VR_003153, partial [Cognaticolwellia sp.]
MWWMCALAQAQEVSQPVVEETWTEPEPAAQAQMALEAALALQVELAAQQAQVAQLQQVLSKQGAASQELLDAAALALDPAEKTADRMVALKVLADSGNPAVMPILRAASFARSAALRNEALRLAFLISEEDGVALANFVVNSSQLNTSARNQGIAALENAGMDGAGHALVKISRNEGLPRSLRTKAGDAASRAYPAIVEASGPAVGSSDELGVVAFTLGNGVAGGVMLGSVGVWGQSDAATAIGAIGGSMIGVGTGLTYGLTNPVSEGQGARYATNVGWGLVGAELTNAWLVNWDNEQNTRALVRVVGVGAGAGLGWSRIKHNPSLDDSIEMNVAGLVGMGLGVSAYNLAIYPSQVDCNQGQNCGAEQYDIWDRNRFGATLGGAALGIGAQTVLRSQFDPQGNSYALAALVSGEAALASGLLHSSAAQRSDEQSRVDVTSLSLFAASAGFGGTLIATEFYPVSGEQLGLSAWGTALGNGLGGGLPLLVNAKPENILAGMAVGGSLGLAGGLASHKLLDMSGGDLAMHMVAVPIATAEGLLLGQYAVAKNPDFETQQGIGLMLTAGGVTGLASTAISPFVDPQAENMAFYGSSALWGAWFGTLVPIAFVPDGDPEGLLLTSALGIDAGVATGIGLVALGVEPRQTVRPQLVGIGGATMGAMVVALSTDNGQSVAAGAVVGSLLGIGAGSLWE